MASGNDSGDGSSYLRWYDKDPALSKALEQLRGAADRYHAQVALNIIKVILEHRIEEQSDLDGEKLQRRVEDGEFSPEHELRRRWYDVNETLRSAMQLLQECPDELQHSIIPTIAKMIEDTLREVF